MNKDGILTTGAVKNAAAKMATAILGKIGKRGGM